MKLTLLQLGSKLRIRRKNSSAQRILIVRLYGIGNNLIATSYIKSLHHHFPQIDIHLLCENRGLGLLEHNPNLTLHVLNAKQSIFQQIKILSKTTSYDFIFLAYPFNDSYLLSYLRLFFSCPVYGFHPKDPFHLQLIQFKDHGGHEAEENFLALEKLFKQPLQRFPTKIYGISKKKNEGLKIGIHTGVFNQHAKNWGEEKFTHLIKEICCKLPNSQIYLFGSTLESESNEKIKQVSSTIENLSGKLSLLESASKIAEMNYFIGNDSSLIHIANALHVPYLVIFGPTDETKSSPWQPIQKHILIRDTISCRPCYRFGTNINCHQNPKFLCLKNISVDLVFQEFMKLLQSTNS